MYVSVLSLAYVCALLLGIFTTLLLLLLDIFTTLLLPLLGICIVAGVGWCRRAAGRGRRVGGKGSKETHEGGG